MAKIKNFSGFTNTQHSPAKPCGGKLKYDATNGWPTRPADTGVYFIWYGPDNVAAPGTAVDDDDLDLWTP